MPLNARIEDRDIQRTMESLVHFSTATRPVMEEIGQKYERRVLENFAHESDPEGNKWQKLSSATLLVRLGEKKRSKKSGYLSKAGSRYLASKMILVESGHLKRSIHYKADAKSVTIGVGGEIPYAAIHQFGGTIKPKNKRALSFGFGPKGAIKIPARPYLAMNDGNRLRLAARDKTMILEVLYLRLSDAVEGRR